MFKPALLFQTGMTLQRGKRVPIWGTAEPYAEVTAAIQNKTARTRAGADGRWQLEVGPLSVSFAETLTLRSGAACLEYTDVQVGDVWLAAGQSNMEFYMEYDADSAEETPACADDALRFFDYPKVAYPGQLAEADYLAQHGRWRKAAPDQLRWFSAVGYYFAKEIRARYGVPVAIVGCNWSGTPACTWMSEESLMEGGGRIYLDEYRAALETLDRDAYEAEFRANPANWRIAPLDDEGYDAMMRGDFEPTDPNTPLEPIPVPGPKSEKRPGALYESMLCCVAPYALRGILYYQGESDGDRYNQLYETLFPALIRGYRRLWGEDLPFLFVQLAPFGRWQNCDGTRYALIRQAQQHAADTVPGTGMAVITDVGMQHDIHPKKKKPVGQQLALQARRRVYGEDILCEAPTLAAAEPGEGTLTLRFANAGEGLYLAGRLPTGTPEDPRRLDGLTLTLDGAPVDTAALTAEADGDTVTLRGAALHKGKVTAELGRGGWYCINLYNSAALPARPAQVTAE